MKVHVTDLKHGDCLMTDTFNGVGLHVLPKGTHVEREEISILIRHKIHYVDIEPRSMQQTGSEEEQSHGLHDDFDHAILNYESIFLEALTQGSFSQSMVDDTLKPLLETLEGQKDVVSCCFCWTGMTLIHTIILYRLAYYHIILHYGWATPRRSVI